MRKLLLLAVLTGFTQLPLAYAQGETHPRDTNSNMPAVDSASGSTMASSKLDPTNCGTPDDRKPCGPMPRKAMKTMPTAKAMPAAKPMPTAKTTPAAKPMPASKTVPAAKPAPAAKPTNG